MQSFHIIVDCTPVYCTLVYCTLVYCTIADRSDRFATSIYNRDYSTFLSIDELSSMLRYYLYIIIAFIFELNMYFYTLYFSTNKHIIIITFVHKVIIVTTVRYHDQ